MKKDINKTKLLIGVLISVIVVLLGFVIYAFVISPSITSFVVEAQTQGYEYAILQIAQQASECQQVPLTIGNQTINLVSVDCLNLASN